MITFKDLVKANETIKSIDVKGKEYAMVNERVKAFRLLYPEGSIETTLLSCENGVAIVKAEVRNEFGTVLGTGTAYEKESSSFINKTSYIENCETSAVGRALGFAGIGVDVSIASYEEVANAIHNQDENKPSTKGQIEKVQKLYLPDEIQKMMKRLKVEELKDITYAQAQKMIDKRDLIADDTPTY